jgi:hypothetical protein
MKATGLNLQFGEPDKCMHLCNQCLGGHREHPAPRPSLCSFPANRVQTYSCFLAISSAQCFWIYPRCCMYQQFVLFVAEYYFNLLIHSSVDRYLCFHRFGLKWAFFWKVFWFCLSICSCILHMFIYFIKYNTRIYFFNFQIFISYIYVLLFWKWSCWDMG